MPSGTSTLFSATIRGRSSSPPYCGELGLDHVQVAERVAARLEGRAVDDVHERAAALDVPQELQAEALALAGAGDQAGDVGDGVADLAGLHDAEVGHQGGERVVGDLGPGRGERGDQAGLAGAREADQRDVGDRLELEDDVVASPGSPSRAKPGALRRAEASAALPRPPRPPWAATYVVPAPTRSASTSPVETRLTTVPLGTGEDQVLPVGAAAVTALARLAVGGPAVRGVVVVEQRGRAGVDHAGARRRRGRRCRRRARRAA